MSKSGDIRKLVEAALDEKLVHKTLQIDTLPPEQAALMAKYLYESVAGAIRVIDTSGVRHALKNHGSPTKEKSRGQIAITLDDFLFVPEILRHPDKIDYLGKNALGQDLFMYTQRQGGLRFVVQAVRYSKKKGNKIVFHTMYKRK